jgi:hypothetical protein
VYFGRQDPEVPLPLLKLELVGSQAISPAAAMTGSEAANATPEVPDSLAGPENNDVKPSNAAIKMEYPKRLKKIALMDLSLWLRWTRHRIWLIYKNNFC